MKNFLLMFIIYIAGIVTTQLPDIIQLYDDYIMRTYQKRACNNLHPNECHFHMFYDLYEKENPKLSELSGYFLLGEGPLYWVLSRKCSNDIFYNPSATNKSGQITKREYFKSRCSQWINDISDLIFVPRS